MTLPKTFLPSARPTPAEAAADMRRRADENQRRGDLGRALYLRGLAARLIAATRRPAGVI